VGVIKELVTEGEITTTKRVYTVGGGDKPTQDYRLEAYKYSKGSIVALSFSAKLFDSWEEFEEALTQSYERVTLEVIQVETTSYINKKIK